MLTQKDGLVAVLGDDVLFLDDVLFVDDVRFVDDVVFAEDGISSANGRICGRWRCLRTMAASEDDVRVQC
jgi:hypothetical protein